MTASLLLGLLLAMPANTAPAAPMPQQHAFHRFQPSALGHPKRALKEHFSWKGWAFLIGCGLLIAGVVALTVALWPGLALGWRIALGLGSAVVSAAIAFTGLFVFSYSYATDRDLHASATQRLNTLGRRMGFEPAHTWCFPDDGYRIGVAANTDGLLLVDRTADEGWLIPKQHLVDVGLQRAEAVRLPDARPDAPVWRTQKLPRRYDESTAPRQTLRFELRDAPLSSITLVYRGNPCRDSSETIVQTLRNLWQ